MKLASVATDVLGKSGRDMLTALIEGTTDAAVLADLARGFLRAEASTIARGTGRTGTTTSSNLAQAHACPY